MSANDEILQGVGEAFDELRAEFFPGSAAQLLKTSTETNSFDVVYDVQDRWFFEDPNSYRSEFLFQLADKSDEITLAMKSATHLRIDDDCYVIKNRDPTPPKGTGIFWRLLCNKYLNEQRFRNAF